MELWVSLCLFCPVPGIGPNPGSRPARVWGAGAYDSPACESQFGLKPSMQGRQEALTVPDTLPATLSMRFQGPGGRLLRCQWHEAQEDTISQVEEGRRKQLPGQERAWAAEPWGHRPWGQHESLARTWGQRTKPHMCSSRERCCAENAFSL